MNSDVRWQWVTRLAGMALVVLAGLLLLLQIRVSSGLGGRLACGSSWDVISGRVGWREWWSADQTAGALLAAQPASLPRTLRCPDAVDARMWLAAALFLAAMALVAIGEVVASKRDRRALPPRWSSRPASGVARACLWVGGALTLVGLVGIAFLTADPRDPLFLYVNRPVVVLIGLLLLSPAVLIVVLGLLARPVSARSPGRSPDDEAD